jgi:hypothetical protein
MNARKKPAGNKIHPGEKITGQSQRGNKLARVARGTLLAVGLTAAQLGEETTFFGEKFFHRNLVDRLHSTSLTRYHE